MSAAHPEAELCCLKLEGRKEKYRIQEKLLHSDTNCSSFVCAQVWCVESEEQQYHNWTVDSGQHSLDIAGLTPGRRYWLTIAAVNGAGVGAQSDPHGFVISEQNNTLSEEERLP